MLSVWLYGIENVKWEEVFEYVNHKGLHYFSGDPPELYKAVLDGKLTRRNVPDVWGGYHHKVRPEWDYFIACIKPMEMRFTVSTIYDQNGVLLIRVLRNSVVNSPVNGGTMK